MLTNSPEYKALKNRVAKFLSIGIDDIYSIENPMRNKKLPYWLVTVVDSRFGSILLKDSPEGFSVVNS